MCMCVRVRFSGDSLSHVALGGGVEGGQLDRAGVLGPHLEQHLLKRVELIVLVHVVLVDLKTRERLNGGGRAVTRVTKQALRCDWCVSNS